MADAPNVELQTSPAEQPPIPGAKERIEAMLENPAKTDAEVAETGNNAVTEIKEYTKIADDPAVKAQADAIEQEILQKIGTAQAEIKRIRVGEVKKPAQEMTPEEARALGDTFTKIGNEAAAARKGTSSSEEAVGSVEAPAAQAKAPQESVVEAPSAPEAPAEKETPAVGELAKKLSEIVVNYQNEKTPLKVLQRQLVKLMAEAHPDKTPDNAQAKDAFVLMSQLNEQMKLTADSGKVGDVSAVQKGIEALSVAKTEQAEPSAQEVDQEFSRMHAEAMGEKLDPKELSDKAMDLARAAAQHGGALTSEQSDAWMAISEQAEQLEKEGKSVVSLSRLKRAFDSNVGNPVGLLEALSVFSSEIPDAGFTSDEIERQLQEKATETSGQPAKLADLAGRLAQGLMGSGGETGGVAASFRALQDDFENASSRAPNGSPEWQDLATVVSLLKSAMDTRLSPTAADRLRVLKVFAEDAPELAAAHGITLDTLDEQLAKLPAFSPEENAVSTNVAETVAVGGPQAEVAAEVASSESVASGEDPLRMVKKLGEEAESAFAAGDEGRLKIAVGEIEGRINGQIASRQKELEGLYAVSSTERTPEMQSKIDSLEYSNAIDRKTLDLRNTQLDLITLQKEKKQVDADVASVQEELKAFEGQQSHNLLAQNAEEGRVLARVEADPKTELEQKLQGLLAKQKDLADQVGKAEGQMTELSDTILQLGRLLERSKLEQKRDEKQPKSPSGIGDASASFTNGEDYSSGSSGRGGSNDIASAGGDKKPGIIGHAAGLLDDMARPHGSV
ncbi:MAG: hypothetical protein WA001_04965 [Patescibacteria group bacterium]